MKIIIEVKMITLSSVKIGLPKVSNNITPPCMGCLTREYAPLIVIPSYSIFS